MRFNTKLNKLQSAAAIAFLFAWVSFGFTLRDSIGQADWWKHSPAMLDVINSWIGEQDYQYPRDPSYGAAVYWQGLFQRPPPMASALDVVLSASLVLTTGSIALWSLSSTRESAKGET